MGGVGKKLSLAFVGRADTRQESVEGVSQARDLVVPAGVHGQHRGVAGTLGRDPVPLHRSQCRAGDAIADQGRRDQGCQIGNRQLQQEFAERLVVLASADRRRHDHVTTRGLHLRGDDTVGPLRRREHAADILLDRGASRGPGDRVGADQTGGGVATDDAAAAVIDLVALTGGVGRWGVAGGEAAGDHRVVGVEVLVELPVQGELHAPEHERPCHQQDHGHRGRHGQDQSGDDGPVTERAAPQRHGGSCSRR